MELVANIQLTSIVLMIAIVFITYVDHVINFLEEDSVFYPIISWLFIALAVVLFVTTLLIIWV
jgi:hypothetical protein